MCAVFILEEGNTTKERQAEENEGKLQERKLLRTYLPMKMEETKRFETSLYKIQTPGNFPEGSIQNTAKV